MRMDIKIKIGNRIRDLRQKKSISQNDLAYYAGMDRSYLAGVESGKRNISILNIEKLAAALEISIKELFDDKVFEEITDIK